MWCVLPSVCKKWKAMQFSIVYCDRKIHLSVYIVDCLRLVHFALGLILKAKPSSHSNHNSDLWSKLRLQWRQCRRQYRLKYIQCVWCRKLDRHGTSYHHSCHHYDLVLLLQIHEGSPGQEKTYLGGSVGPKEQWYLHFKIRCQVKPAPRWRSDSKAEKLQLFVWQVLVPTKRVLVHWCDFDSWATIVLQQPDRDPPERLRRG
jgi:hypothetical protein